MLAQGAYRALAWVVSVMLPPMAIFFPLFTLLEDAGFLPRVAFNLDRLFQRCDACGKQGLTMCMGLGCNAVGVTGCRIIDSPRERLIAILTNSFTPCNGRFPLLIAMMVMFFGGASAGAAGSAISAALLTGLVLLSIAATFAASKLLSRTLLRGQPSAFVLELPPYRRPQIGRVIVRSLLDRTLFVLGRAAMVAAPAGAVIWAMANLRVGDATVLARSTGFLDPFARLLGMDGVILTSFALGMPANEIVAPILAMAYLAQGSLTAPGGLPALKALLTANGWTALTAANVMIFSLMHWPCSTTCLTIRRETGGWRWVLLAIALPTLFGMLSCLALTGAVRGVSALWGG
jgi:ferrous iron transport protein B